jgi:hypothetical protein
MKKIVFLGPTLSENGARKILDADYRPPAKEGDIVSVIHKEKPDIIALIDCEVFGINSVWHKEILNALQNGIKVFGAAQVGALRAAEMEDFGMIGTGKVFDKFKNNELEDDEEVLCKYIKRDNGYHRISESMVNIRYKFEKAKENGIIKSESFDKLITVSKSQFYQDRVMETILELAGQNGISEEELDKLKNSLAANSWNIQKEDAVELLTSIAAFEEKNIDYKNNRRNEIVNDNRLFNSLYNRDRIVAKDGIEMRLYEIANNLVMNNRDIEDMCFNAYNRELAVFLTDLLEIRIQKDEVESEVKRYREKLLLSDDSIFSSWLNENDLLESEFYSLMENLAKIRKLHKWFLMRKGYERNTRMILDELRLDDSYSKWKSHTANKNDILKDRKDELLKIINGEDFEDLLKDHIKHSGYQWTGELSETAEEAGLDRCSFNIELAKEKIINDYYNSELKKMFF